MKVLAADIGGTFTDLVYYDQEENLPRVLKVHSTPKDFAMGVINGIREFKIDIQSIDAIVHGTTAATNAIIERKGAVCGLLTTKGFRDILEIRRRARPHTYGLDGQANPLIPRNLRLEVKERIDSEGTVLVEVDEAEVEAQAKELLKRGAEAIVVSLLHSYTNPVNEKKAEAAIRKIWPNDYIIIASDLLREFREFERTSTAACNAYVQPIVTHYLTSLKNDLKKEGYKHDLLIIQSNGGVVSSALAGKFPVNTLLSGPAAGVIAARYMGEVSGNNNVISCDMGGTTFDVSLIENGKPLYTNEIDVDFGIPLKVAQTDIATIGAGGGSIAWIDRAGILQVGPQSAGADPGPACYRKGGTEPTVTDANLLLGRLNSVLPYGGEGTFELDIELAKKAIQEKIADPLGYDIYQASLGIIKLSNTNMAGAIRSVSVRRGYDPRDFILVAFGGAGPMHVNSLIKEMEMPKAVIPYSPGVFCAIGCLTADFRRDFVQTVNKLLDDIGVKGINDIFTQYAEQGKQDLIDSEIPFTEIVNLYELEMQYEGQLHTIRASFDSLPPSEDAIMEKYNEAYARRFRDTLPGMPTRVVNLRCSTIGIRPRVDLTVDTSGKAAWLKDSVEGTRPVYFDNAFVDTTVYERSRIPIGETIYGPAIIEQRDSVTVLEPDSKIQVDPYDNLVMEVQ
ncbi:hydantoinase/oxoprolinase family protein [Chloroflexota bacterium]